MRIGIAAEETNNFILLEVTAHIAQHSFNVRRDLSLVNRFIYAVFFVVEQIARLINHNVGNGKTVENCIFRGEYKAETFFVNFVFNRRSKAGNFLSKRRVNHQRIIAFFKVKTYARQFIIDIVAENHFEIFGVLVSGNNTCCNVRGSDIYAVNPKFHNILLGLRHFGEIIFCKRHFCIKHNAGFILRNNREVGETRNCIFTERFTCKRHGFINVLVNTFSSHSVESIFFVRRETEETLNTKIFQHVENARKRFNGIYVGVNSFGVAFKSHTRQFSFSACRECY